MPSEGIGAFAQISRIESLLPGCGWYLIWGSTTALRGIADALHEEAHWQGVSAERVEVAPLETLARRLRAALGPMLTVIVTGVSALELARVLESDRSQLPVDRQVVLVATREDALTIQEEAPHFASFLEQIEAFVEDTIPVIDAAERATRLASLRARTGKTDDEVIALAQAGKLPADPEYAEWLLLLGSEERV